MNYPVEISVSGREKKELKAGMYITAYFGWKMGTTLDLINAIEKGDSQAIETHFESAMADRVADKLDNMREYVAKNMFKEDTDVYDYSEIVTESDLVEDVEDFMQTEEYEQLDEISKNTILNYYEKAIDNKKRLQGKNAYMRRTETTPGTYGELRDPKDHAEQKEINNRKIKRRNIGIKKAEQRLTAEDIEYFFQTEDFEDYMQTEEYEQLDEISKKTLLKYYMKAKDTKKLEKDIGRAKGRAEIQAGMADHFNRMHKSEHSPRKIPFNKEKRDNFKDKFKKHKPKEFEVKKGYKMIAHQSKQWSDEYVQDYHKAKHKLDKRNQGIEKARQRLTKEDIDQLLDEASRPKKIEDTIQKEFDQVYHKHGDVNKDHFKDIYNKVQPQHPEYSFGEIHGKISKFHRNNILNRIYKPKYKMKSTNEEVDQLEEAKKPTAIKLYHHDDKGKETYSIHFSGQDAAYEEKRRKKLGHKTVAHALMYGQNEEGERVNH